MKNSSWLRITITGLVVTGVWLPRCLEKSLWRFSYYAFAIFFQTTMFGGIFYIELEHLFKTFGDIEKTVEVSVLLLTHVAQLCKVSFIWLRQGRIKKLLEILDGPTFTPANKDRQRTLHQMMSQAYIANKTIALSSIFTGFMWGIFPLLKPTLTLPLGHPNVDVDSFMFKLMYAYEMVSISWNAFGDAAEDFIVGGLMLLAAAQLQILCDDLSSIGTRKEVGTSVESEAASDDEKALSCAKYHQSIISIVKELDDIFGAPVLYQFAASSLIICLTAFKIVTSNEFMELMTMISYLICILVEVLVYCYSGNILMLKSEAVLAAVYCSGWINTSVKTQKVLLLIMVRSLKPLTVTAGKIFHLSLATFTAILKSSYSYFAVLNQTQKD